MACSPCPGAAMACGIRRGHRTTRFGPSSVQRSRSGRPGSLAAALLQLLGTQVLKASLHNSLDGLCSRSTCHTGQLDRPVGRQWLGRPAEAPSNRGRPGSDSWRRAGLSATCDRPDIPAGFRNKESKSLASSPNPRLRVHTGKLCGPRPVPNPATGAGT